MPQAIAAEIIRDTHLEADQYVVITDYLRESMDCMNMQCIVSEVDKALRRFADVAVSEIYQNENGELFRIMPKDYGLTDFFMCQVNIKSMAEEVLEAGETVYYPLSQCAGERGRKELERMGGQAVLGLPVLDGGSVMAVMIVVLKEEDTPKGEVGVFSRMLCGFLAIQLKSAIRHDNLIKEANDRNKSEDNLDVIFHGSVDMIGIFDRDGYLKRLNPAFEARLGYTQEELSGKPITEFAHPDDRDYVQYVLDNIVREGTMGGLCHRFLNSDRRIIFLELKVRYMEESAEIIAMARDVTNQREVEAKNMALEQSIAMERMKTEFFSNISHEFKTPINIILSSVDLLKLKLRRDDEEMYDNQYKRFFTYTEQNSFKLLRLINNLLDCTKIDSGSLKLLARNCFIVPFVRQVVETTESYAHAHKITIQFQTDMEEGVLLYCDQDKIDRILLNLISNSIKHTKEGGKICVLLYNTPTHVQMSVADNGEGIPIKMLPHIFEKFRVYEEGFVKSCDGTGVGLSIVKGLTELHGGTVSVSSRRGEGTIFTVTLSKKLRKSMTVKRVKMVSEQQDAELHQSRLQMEMSNIE